jgi:hypothetical protein
MEVIKKPTSNKMLKIYDQKQERVREFKYLGRVLTEDNDITTELKNE